MTIEQHRHEIAIIGMACRFPDANSSDQYWQNLIEGRNSIKVIPPDRWDWQAYWGNPQKEDNKTNSKWGGFIEDVDKFDPLFFNISPKEANYIDPQHRLFLETVWHVIENAGYAPKQLSGRKIGVYAGVSKNDYAELMAGSISAFVSTGTVHSILANRVSYFFNFHGPSEAVDTACSSSLVALHNAVRDIRDGDCEAAIVGGVNALLSPRMYISHAKSGMLSVDGQCKTYDESANGYVRGEGVGAIMLKPLDKALEDRDQILGIIKATAINHGGKSNFLTAPNVAAQADVVYTALKKADVDPRNVSYIEAHGTGTPLGDPIEINALKKAYDQYFADKNLPPSEHYCGLGSVKTNIGHLESAAGMASIIKVLLGMKHGMLPPICNFNKLNPYISLEQSPFYIVSEQTEWKKREIGGKLQPRQAGVSGFGMGGVNAHVILEEPPKHDVVRSKSGEPRLILLSAKEGRIKLHAQRLLDHLRSSEGRQQHLDDIAFTLMFGRADLEERFACIAGSTEQLTVLLERFLADQLPESCHYGTATGKKEQPSVTAGAADDLSTLAASWVKGEAIEWEATSFPGQRVALPGYPFVKQRCWFEQSNLPSATAVTSHSSTPPQPEQSSKSGPSLKPDNSPITVSHEDPIVRDHVVQHVKLLPGVGYLELVRRAHASRGTANFSNLYWLTPASFADEPRELRITMQESGFTVKTGAETHCQGTVQWQAQPLPDERIDIAAVMERCQSLIEKPAAYRLFEASGLSYGPSFQVIDTLRWNEQEAVGKVDAGNGERDNAGILDGGLQTVVGLSVQNGTASDAQYVPYCAESFQYADNLVDVRYYYVKQHPTAKATALQFDVYYCDEQGKVLAVMRKFVKRAYAKKTIHYYTTGWRKEAGAPNAASVTGVVYQPLLDNADDYAAAFAKMRADNATFSHLIVQAKNPGPEDLRQLLLLVQALIKAKFKQSLRILYVLPNADPADLPFLYAAGGLARTLKYENPRFSLEVVSSDGEGQWNAELQLPPAPLHEAMYRGGQRYVREVVTIDRQPQQSGFAFRKGGVYLLAGGTGGLGQIFAEYLAKNFQARLILFGRRAQNADIERLLKKLEQFGGSADYLQADIGNEAQLTEAVAAVRTKYGQINGVIQGSGINEDSFILRKSVDSFDRVLQPKIQGTVQLDRATASDPLDFFVMFSSVASLMPNQGQCDYATGNSFIDHFAQYRRELAAENKRSGITIAINWPLWANGGMQVAVEEKEHLLRVFGMQPLGTEQGLVLFGQALQMAAEAGFAHILGIEGDKVKINHHFKIQEPSAGAGVPEELLPQLVSNDLCKVIAQAFQIPQFELHAQTSFGDLGVESISILNMTHLVNQYFGIDFKPTLLFEYETPQQIVDYMLKDKRDEVRASYAKLGAVGSLYRSTGLIDLDKSGASQGLYQRGFDNREFYMVDHVVEEQYNVPGACYIEMARQAGALDQPGKKVVKLTNNYWAKQLSSKGAPFSAYIALTKKGDRSDYTIYSLGDGQAQVVHATGTIRYEPYGAEETAAQTLDLAGIRRRCIVSRTRDQAYAQIHAEGLMVGPTFMPMQEIVLNEEEALATLVLPETVEDTYDDYLLHPTTLTGVFQTAIINNRIHGDDDRDFIPIAIESIEVLRPIPRKCLVYSEVSAKTKNNQDIKKFNLTVCDETGLVVAKLTNFALKNKATSPANMVQPAQQAAVSVQGDLDQHAQHYLREMLAPVIGIEPAAFRTDAAFEKYGINSVMILELNKVLEDQFGSELSKTLFFEYRNLSELADYFLEEHREALAAKIRLPEPKQEQKQTDLTEMAQASLKGLLAPVIGIEPSAFKPQEVFENYGINSVMILELNKILEDEFGGDLSKTLFFEYRNLAELTDYFLDEHRDVLASKLQVPQAKVVPVTTAAVPAPVPVQAAVPAPAPVQAAVTTPAPIQAAVSAPAPTQAAVSAPAPAQAAVPAPAPARSRDIAIIGVAGRYPHADTLEQFWSNLLTGRDSIEEVPSDRFDCQLSTKWGSFINDVDKFDPQFFNIPPRVAESIDPQERLFLQTAWQAMEDAGYTRDSLQSEMVGVFVGAMWQPYLELGVLAQQQGHQVAPSTLLYSIANRVSYFCNFNGPSFTVDTACSSSLTALHLACQSIQYGDSDLALVGGVNLSIGASKYVFLKENNFLSSDGRCRSFGEGGNGYVPGEGVGAVLLKPLDRAEQDGDQIYGVIKGTAINHGGKTNGYTVPNPTAQTDLILKALGQSQVNPRAISYIEAHGTGTALGDPIEISGLTKAFSKYTREKQYCAIGSAKSNIGHLEAAAGIAGLTKVLLQIKHGKIAPSLHSEVKNPNLDFRNTPFFVPQEATEWKRPVEVVDGQVREYPRIAGISSFGAGGSNAHVIIEEYIPTQQPAVTAVTPDSPVVILLSAKNRERLEASATQLLGAIRSNGWTHADLASIAYTLQVGREAMEERLALLVGSIGELEQKLEGFLRGDEGLQDVYYGQTKRNHELVAIFDADEDLQEAVEKWVVKRKYAKLLDLWIKGLTFNWERAYGDRKPRRISLPTYPFAKERYWLPDVKGVAAAPVAASRPDWSEQAVRALNDYVRTQDPGTLDEVAAGAELQTVAVAELELGDIRLGGKLGAEYTQLERDIAKIWADVFGFREINVHDSLFELGADSISMMKLADQMSEALNADVTLDRLMKYPTVTKLAEYVVSGVGEAKRVVYPSAIIDPDNVYEPFSLTDVQMAYLMGRDDTYELGGVSTHIYFEYETELDIARLNQSLQRVIDRHPMLRSIFLPNGEQQMLSSVPRYDIQADDVLGEGEEEVSRKIEEVRGRMSHQVRDPEKWPLFEFHAVRTSADTHRLFVSVDMLIADGSSYDMIAREMLTYYHNPDMEPEKLDITFRDYMNTYMEFKRSETYMRDRQYWLDQLPTFPSAPALPLIASPAEVGIPSFSRLFKSYPKEAWDRVKAMARRNNVTPTALLATAYASMLAYWSNQSRLAINLTVFNRFPFHEQINQLVGDFTSIMLLGVDLDSAPTFWDRTRHVQDRMMEALGHRHYDGIEFIREYARYHGLGHQAAMPIVFTSLLQGDGWNSWADIGEQVLGVSQTPQVMLDHQVYEVHGELMLNWDYVDTLFDPELINKMFAHYTGMIEAWMAEEEASLPSLPEPDRAFIEAYNQTAEPIHAETLHGLFRAQAARTPEREAVRFGDESLTYAELDRRSNQVARYLLERGVGRNDLIGVYGKRHPSTIVSIFGVLKAGAAYVPVDPDYPEDRVQYILSNSNCKVFLEEGAYEKEGIDQCSSAPLDVAHHPEDLAYVIYTSGSTGRPKGVVITHQAAANTVQDMNRKFAVTAEDRILGISSICFDLSVYDIFGALAAGAALVQIADQRDVRDMIDIVVRERISIWNSVPAILDLTVDTLEKGFVNTDLRVVLLSGDKIPLPLPDKVKKHFTKTSVISLGGATEASIWSIYYPIEEVRSNWKTIPYGMPLANQTFYVLNPKLELCPVGVQGELYIGGIGLAQGYLNDEEKTTAAFFVHPMFGPLYKTGDHGVWRPEGHIEFLGRIDHQVKIRGYRVELGEIETCLMQHPSVKNATVLDRTDEGGKKYLCAYIVPEAETAVHTAALREHLGGTLPDYMVPSYFVAIDAIPLTPNGKVDRKALPEPEVQAADEATDREARNETEATLQAICQEVLGMPHVSVIANFFELGMNSVLMVQMINRIGHEMNAKIAFRDFVRQNSIEELAEYLASNVSEAKKIVYPPAVIDHDNLYEPFGLTDVQMAYLMGRDETYELGGTSTHVYLEYDTELDITRLNQSLQSVIDRHPMLRSVFLPNGEQQILSTAPRYEIQVEDVSGADEAMVNRKIEEVRERMEHHIFDPEQWPLFEFHAVKTSATTHRLFIGLDALISDGSSFDRIAREMMAFYHDEKAELPQLDITFRDYINSYKQFKNSETYLEDRAYWLDQLATFPSAPALPLMASPAEVGVPTFSRLTKTFPRAAWDRLKAMARKNNVTSSALIATAYASVVAYWSNQQRLAINLTVFNRFPFHEQIEQLIGDFTSIMLLGVDLNAGSTLWDRARHVQDRLMEALEHRHYDGIEFIREYSRHHGLGHQAAMPVAFTSMLHGDALDSWAKIGELQLGLTRTSQVTLDHQAIEFHGDLLLNWDYVDTLFDPALIEKMFAHYTGMLEAWMAGEDDKLPSLPEEDRAFIDAYNRTSEPIPTETLHGLFRAQVARTPEREAVRFGNESLSYEELDRRSNQVARYLLERGVGRNDLIGVFGKRHPSTIVSILGILKAGAAYVPVDPDYPEDRVQYILSNSACKVFLGEGAYETEGIEKYSADAVDVLNHPEDLAYVIYTSGSTGRPKGVVITHQGAANTIQDMNQKFAVGPEDRILGISSMCFDLSVYDIFGALAAGAALVQIADQRDVRDMIDVVVNERISVWNSVPAILDLTVDTLEKGFVNTDLRVVLLSGDKIPLPLPDKVKQHFKHASVISLGGATEASIWSIYYPIEEVKSNWKTIPYGMPLAYQTFYVLNPQLELCPIGVQGELYIGGVGLAQGYLNDEEKTRAAFFVHPTFGPLYKTGDHGVWRAEGYIEFLGRIDHQVKIRGYRVELGEIETTLIQHPSVKNATVIDRTDAGGKKYLCAYIVPEADADVQTAVLREHLGGTLPDYMVPSYFVAIEAIPLTPNGKVDRKALPEPEVKASDMAEDRDPRNETEATLQAICQDVLGMPNVSVLANFFELGLNSVLMVQMINRIGREMNAKISFRDFVRQNNIEQLAVFIGQDGGGAEVAPVEYASKQPDPEHLGEEFPLTDIQMAYLMGRDPNFELGGISNHFYGELLTELDMKQFQLALNKMIHRHPMLRAIVLPHGQQKILLDVPEYEVVVEDLRHLSEEDHQARLWEERNRMSHYMFPTDQWPLFEYKSFRLTEETHMLLFGYDMLIADQASMDIFSKELMGAYRGEELPELAFTFRDYMLAYEEFKSSETYKRDRAYWQSKLENFPSAPALTLKENPLKVKDPHFHNHAHVFTQEQWAELKRQANQRNITPSALLATAYATVLAHWSNQPQLALNLTVFNRYPFHEDVPAIIGDFTSVMLVDVNLQSERTLWEEASELQATLMDGLEHRHYDGVEFIREYSRQHNLGTKAAMPFIFTSALFGDQSQAGSGWAGMGEITTAMNQTSQLYIDHQVSETVNNELSVRWFYVDQLFEPHVIRMMFEQYVGIVLALIEGKDTYQFELTESDVVMIERYNQTEEPIRKATLHELFAEQVERVPDGVAVKLDEESFTYRELDLRSNQIAHALRAAGVERGDGIGVLAKRTPETIANMLGILKAGAAYVPVDPAYPEDRQTYILENSGCKLFLQPDYYHQYAKSQSDAALTDNCHPEDIAYVIYTSGSTGRPKGVVIAHHAAANTIQDINNKFEVNENDRIIGVSSMCFDLSVYDIYGALSTGATLVMIPNQRDVDNILDVIEREQITFWNSAPPIMDMVVEGLGQKSDLFLNTSLRAVLLSGDWIPLTLPDKVRVYFPNSEIVSLGGATEASIWSIYYPVDEVQPGWASIPYGRPLANQTFHVLNYQQEPCPVGIIGELYIGGVGLAEGYHNDLEKTAAAFFDHPQLGRLYRTGDFGVLHQDGYIEFMGRKDSQVKIRGYRVELNEINSNLLKHPAVSNAIVIDRTDANRKKYLCAYYVPEPESEVTVSDLREALEKDLPEYMVPSYFVALDAIPLTPNGKVDRKALPEPDLSEGRITHVEAQTELEKQLVEIWMQVLELDRVGTLDDFFDIGGNSLLIVRVKGQLDKLFPDCLTFADLFTYTTIDQLAAFLEESR